MTFMHIGKDFVPPDVEGKVTGDAKYVEDFAPEGMVYARLLTSPLPSGRVVSIDASEVVTRITRLGDQGIRTARHRDAQGIKPGIIFDHDTQVTKPFHRQAGQ